MYKKERYKIQKLQHGDQRVFRELCEKHYAQFFRYTVSALKSRQLAASVLEEACLEIWKSRHNLNPNVSFCIQLFKVVESRVLAILESIVADERLEEEIRNHIGANHISVKNEATPDKEQSSLIEAIQNEILQQQLLHELASTRR